MKKFEDLVRERNDAIKECNSFINTFKIWEFDRDILELNNLLKEKRENLNNLKYNNYIEIALAVEEINDKIYRQITMLNNLGKLTYDSEICVKYNKLYNLKHIKYFMAKQIYGIKKYNKSLIALLGLIPFMVYFIIGKNIGYFSLAGSASIFSILSALAISGLGFFIILYLFPILHLLLVFASNVKEVVYKKIFYIVYLLAIIASVVLVGVSYNFPKIITTTFLNYYFMIFMIIMALYYILCYYRKTKKFDFELLFFILAHGFLSFITPFIILIFAYIRVDSDLYTIIPLVIFMVLFVILSVGLMTTKDMDIFKVCFWSLVIINFAMVVIMSGRIIQVADLGNINYKMLSLKKDALNALPESVCQNKQNGCIGDGAKDGCYAKQKAQIVSYNKQKAELAVKDGNETYIFSGVNDEIKFIDANGADIGVASSDEVVFENSVLTYGKNDPLKASAINLSPVCKTYALRQDDSVKLYNVKVLSALGKFYYLQTKSGEKFELDSSLIISKQKAGDTR